MARSKTPRNLSEDLQNVLAREAPRSLTMKEMARQLGMDRWDRREFESILAKAAVQGKLTRIGKNRWRAATEVARKRVPRRRSRSRSETGSSEPMVMQGRYSRARAGFGFVATTGEDREKIGGDVFVPRGGEAGALHGDKVRVEVRRFDPETGRSTGQIVAVLEQANQHILGRVESVFRRDGSGAPKFRVVPHDDRLPMLEIVGGRELDAAAEGSNALVRLTEVPSARTGAKGEVVRILGDLADPEVQVLHIALEAGLRLEFDEALQQAAAELPSDPDPKEFPGRRDLRNVPFVTIDGESARDFDDAVHLEQLPEGLSRLSVAIADVSHYVRPGSLLDQEAVARGTSTYFPDRAIPMLPERLSTELCSLMPNRDRLVLVAEMVHDGRGGRLDVQVYRAVIRSAARLTYTQVATLLSEVTTPEIEAEREQLAAILPMLQSMRELMRRLHQRRVNAGSLDLDLPEALLDLSEEGRAVGARLAPRNDAHRMIEEMMLEANCAVAEFLEAKRVPQPYRVHESPDASSIDDLNQLLAPLGLRIHYSGEIQPKDIQRALHDLAEHRLSRVLSRQVLRSLKQARYTTKNEGHFGLAFSSYCHFTSPIRRYPDLLVHRQIGRILDGEISAAQSCAEELERLCGENSDAERRSMDAERAMVDLKKAELMLDHLLEEESATIVGVEKFGIFVELNSYPVEGLIALDDLPGQFRFDERLKILTSIRGGKRFRLGDSLRVEAVDASLERRRVRFVLAEDPMLRGYRNRDELLATD
ncbi:MAG: ribonuclease R [Candidatus Binatia bacterium]|nr:ribonuclease R [Candidatus Binatia bacterium]